MTTTQQQVIIRAAEAAEMGFWDSAVHRLLAAGWGVDLRPVEAEFKNLGRFYARVIAQGDNSARMPEDSDCPMYAEAYAENFERALEAACRRLVSVMAEDHS